MNSLNRINFWSKQMDNVKLPHSASAVLRPQTAVPFTKGDSGCGQGSCNCGGGCNGECASCGSEE